MAIYSFKLSGNAAFKTQTPGTLETCTYTAEGQQHHIQVEKAYQHLSKGDCYTHFESNVSLKTKADKYAVQYHFDHMCIESESTQQHWHADELKIDACDVTYENAGIFKQSVPHQFTIRAKSIEQHIQNQELKVGELSIKAKTLEQCIQDQTEVFEHQHISAESVVMRASRYRAIYPG